jgi:hypothetical protein
VQCPRCGHQGEGRTFDAGCPSCGYLRFPESTLSSFGRGGGRTRTGSPVLYRILGVVLTLALLGLLALLVLRGR